MEGRAPASPAFPRISRRSLGVAELRPPDAAITGESGCGLARVAVQAFPSFFVIRISSFSSSALSVNRADGIGEIEGKAARARGERVGR